MRSGDINGISFTGDSGLSGYYWSLRTAIDTTLFQKAYHLVFNLPGVAPFYGYHRSYGYSLRCLVVGKV